MTNFKKILIVEDDLNFLDILKIGFEREGFTVALAESGEKALELAQKEKSDLVVMDIMLPGIDGIETAKRIKDAGLKPFMIFLTNLSDNQHIGSAMAVDMCDYLVKADVRVEDIVRRAKEKLGIK